MEKWVDGEWLRENQVTYVMLDMDLKRGRYLIDYVEEDMNEPK